MSPEDDVPLLPQLGFRSSHERSEFLLRVVRFMLARHISFTQIEEALVAGGVPPKTADQLVELVIQNLEGRRPTLDALAAIDVPTDALTALGLARDANLIPPESLLAAALGIAPAPEFAFVKRPSFRAVRHGTPRAILVLTAAIVCAVVLAVAVLVLR